MLKNYTNSISDVHNSVEPRHGHNQDEQVRTADHEPGPVDHALPRNKGQWYEEHQVGGDGDGEKVHGALRQEKASVNLQLSK